MSKTLAKAALIVGAVAAIATGVGAVVGAGFIVGAGVTVGTVATIASVASVALSAAAALTAKKPPTAEATGSQDQFSADPDAGIPYVIGRTGTAGNIIFRRGYDTLAAGANDRQAFVSMLSLGPVNAIEGQTVDRASVAYSASGAALGAFAGFMWSMTQLGAVPESAALGFGADAGIPPGWTAAHKLSGKAAASWTLRFDTKSKLYQSGVPAPMWTVQGGLAYDPRKDSTYPGGSGPHRMADPSDTAAYAAAVSTWTYTENPYLHAIKWAHGIWQRDPALPGSAWQRVMGMGSPIAAIDLPSFVEGANLADAHGWKVGGVIFSGDGKWDSMKKILQAGMGEPLALGARISCLVNAPKVSLATIGIDDVVGEATVGATRPRRDRINTVTPRYRLEANNWQLLPGYPISVLAYVTEDRGKRSKLLDYPFIQSSPQVGTAVRYDIENAREFGPIVLPLKLVWMGFKPGDCVTANLPELGLNNQPLLLLNRELEPANGIVTMTARSEKVEKHAFALGQIAIPAPTPGVTGAPVMPVPSPADWTITALPLTDGIVTPTIAVTGTATNPNADAVLIDYRRFLDGQAVDAGWQATGVEPPTTTRKEITSLLPGVDYEVSIQYRGRGITSDRLILGPVTVESVSTSGPPGAPGSNGVPGISAYAALLTNESHTLPASADGTTANYAGASGAVRVFQGAADVSAAFALTTQDNPQALAVGYASQTYAVTGGLDAGEDAATLTIRATGSGAHAGVVIDKVFSLAKSRAGAGGVAGNPGATGNPGDTGAPGASAKLIFLASTHQTISLDGGGAVQDQTTIFTATRQNSGTGRTVWRLLNGDGSPRTNFDYASVIAPAIGAARISDDVITMTAAEMNARMTEVSTPALIFEVRLDNDAAIADRISVVRVQAGAPGSDAALITVQASTTQVRYDGAGAIEAQDVAFTATRQNSTAGVLWSTYGLNGAELDSPKPAADFVAADPVGWSSAGPDQLTRTAAGLDGIIVAGGGGFAVEARLDGTTIAQRVTVTKVQDGAASTGGDTGLGLLADGATTIIIPASDLDWQNVVVTDVTVQAGRKFRLTLAGSNASYTPEDTGGGPVIGGPDAIARIEITLTGGGTTLALFAGNVSIDAARTLESSALVAASMAFITNTIAGPATLTIRRRREVGPGNDASFTLNYGLERL